MNYLSFEQADIGDGFAVLEAMASTMAAQHAAVMAEVQAVLDWAWRTYPDTHGPVDDGMHWDHDLQVVIEAGGWHRVTLTLTGSTRFVDGVLAAFADDAD